MGGEAQVMTEMLKLDCSNQENGHVRRSQAVESPSNMGQDENTQLLTSAQKMRLDLKKLQSEHRGESTKNNLNSALSLQSEFKKQSKDAKDMQNCDIENTGKSYERPQSMNIEEYQKDGITKQPNQAHSQQRGSPLRFKSNSKIGGMTSMQGTYTPHQHHVRKGQPIKDFIKQIDKLE